MSIDCVLLGDSLFAVPIDRSLVGRAVGTTEQCGLTNEKEKITNKRSWPKKREQTPNVHALIGIADTRDTISNNQHSDLNKQNAVNKRTVVGVWRASGQRRHRQQQAQNSSLSLPTKQHTLELTKSSMTVQSVRRRCSNSTTAVATQLTLQRPRRRPRRRCETTNGLKTENPPLFRKTK